MSSKWTSVNNAIERVKALLEQAGVPLEIQVREICNQFIQSHKTKDISLSSDQLVYASSKTDPEYREVDRLLTVHKFVNVGNLTTASVVVSIPIECKYRRDIELFSFPSSDRKLHDSFPICGTNRGSEFFGLLKNSLQPLSKIKASIPVLVEIKGGETPQKVHEENLVYNAAGSLYDFILTEFDTMIDLEQKHHDEKVDKSKLLEDFHKEVGSKISNWYHFFSRWASKLDSKKIDNFNKVYFTENSIEDITIYAYLPVVCINGPIYEANWNASTGIDSINDIPFCTTVIRKRGWPGIGYLGLLNLTPEVPIVVTNPVYLETVLNIGLDWFNSICGVIANAPEQVINRYALEAAVFRRALRYYETSEREFAYRSDIRLNLYDV